MMQRWDFAVLLLLGASYLVLHADRIAAPPLGRDGWRESDVLMVGRNFCREDASLFFPRIDQRGDGPGITGMEFPLLNYLEGQLACAGADQVAAGRVISLAFACAAIASIYLLTRSHRPRSAALLAACAFAFSPLVFYYGASLQPDLPSLSLALLALVFLERSLSRETRWGLYALSAGAMALAILIKLPAIVFGLPAVVLVLGRRTWRGALRWRYLAYLPIAVLPGFFWYWHARHLQEQYGLPYFYLGTDFAQLVADWADPVFYRRIFMEQLFDVYAFPAISVLALAALALRGKRMPGWVLGMAIAALAYFFVAGSTAAYHYYYGLPAVPILCILAGAWTEELASRWGPPGEWGVTLVLVAILAFYGPHRTRHW
ncbi:MAG TPA: glycosyltransferase family 39 protein, partial [Myxococcaceae bacterium]|nr:glycosyltransferase family 39 protein [Myxococcaceae bacterium]